MIRICLIAFIAALLSAGRALSQEPRLRTGGDRDEIAAAAGYEATIFARRLGHISALARHADGTLYTADRDGGRIFRLVDRRMDGVVDITQPLPHRFDNPSGLAMAGDTLFVTDRGGLWRVVPGGGTPDLVAPFANSGSRGEDHPIMMIGPDKILLGLSRFDGTARLLEIDINSGAATLREDGPGRIIGFASLADPKETASPWILQERDRQLHFGPSLQSVRAINVPAQAVWIDEAKARARMALPDGVYETVATFAGLADKGTPIMSGFRGDSRPGAMISDERGLFIADQAGGRIWRLTPASGEAVQEKQDAKPEPKDRDAIPPLRDLSARPELMRGSSITSASTLGRASTMEPASTLPEADQPRAPSEASASDPNE